LNFKGTMLGKSLSLSHLLFVDYVLLLCDGTRIVVVKLKEFLELYCVDTDMRVNMHKSSVSSHGVNEDNIRYIHHVFPY
jgi:hypothetical protein